MKIKIVPREKVRVSRKSRSKYSKLKDALDKLKPGGEVLKVNYSNEKELNSVRNIAYTFNRETNSNVKSSSDSSESTVFFYVE